MIDLAIRAPRLDGALCAQTDPELFHPEKGRSDQIRKAKAICGRCPVQPECLEWALDNRTVTGILGGTTYSERKRAMKWQRLP